MTLSELQTRHAATLADLTAWRDHLVSWRKSLSGQLLACPPRSPLTQGLKLSIISIDRHIAVDTGNLPLHDLMRADGYDPAAWLGCLTTVERLLAERKP
ncbi:MAG: hypothetical protein Q7J25_11345 [Vicinamibacterales bacterium]|nr:hypothetical protein [Vicinamibacterales bacterium]